MSEQESVPEEPPAAEASAEPTDAAEAEPAAPAESEALSEPAKEEPETQTEEPENVARTMSGEDALPVSESTEAKDADEDKDSKRSSRQDSLKANISLPPEEQKKGTKSSTSLGDRRPSVPKAEDVKKGKLKSALGSIIDIRRASVAGETFDRKAARYMNTYKLESDNPFNPEKVDKILESVVMESLENLTYDPEKCAKQAKWASMSIRARVKALEFDRYKIISVVTIGEKHSQDVFVTCRFLWDSERDRYSTFAMENTYVFAIAQCFGLYYE